MTSTETRATTDIRETGRFASHIEAAAREENLFREFYAEPATPDDISALRRRRRR
jgi:hypothetical protein